jgi:hypothetical protein
MYSEEEENDVDIDTKEEEDVDCCATNLPNLINS